MTGHAPGDPAGALALPYIAPPRLKRASLAAAAVGAVAFLAYVRLDDAGRAWQALLVNVLFFAGIAQAGVVFSALLQATSARWGRPLKRVAEATGAFLPAAFVLTLVLLAGIGVWAPWVAEPVEGKTAWLNVPFFVVREVVAIALLSGLSLVYVYRSVRPDVGMLDESGVRPATGLAARCIADWQGIDRECAAGQRAQDRLAVALLIAYGWVYTLIAFDFVMSLEPRWFSTLFGGYYFIGALFAGLAFVAIVAAIGSRPIGIAAAVSRQQLHDIGKLLFGFSILWAYMFWSQYLVIWYGDLPEETEFIYHRMHGQWAIITWTVAAAAFVIPFTTLLSRALKMHPKGLATVAAIALAGMWLERYILVAPSLWHEASLPLGVPELLMTAGVGGLFAWSYLSFLERFPTLPVSDPKLAAPTGLH